MALYRTGPVEPGMRVFLHAAAGGVGLAVVDLARRAGLEVVGAASSHFKRERLQAEGVKHVVDSRRARVDRVARALYGKNGGFDIVIDSVGGRSIGEGLRALKPGGRLVSCGVARMSGGGVLGALRLFFTTPRIHPLALLRGSRGIFGDLADDAGAFRHHDHRAGAQARTALPHRVEVQCNIEVALGQQSDGNNALVHRRAVEIHPC